MDIDEFEERITAELEHYREYYEEYNRTLEKTLALIGELKLRFKHGRRP